MKLFCAFICVASVFADDDTGVEVKMRQQKVIQLLFDVFMLDHIQSFMGKRIIYLWREGFNKKTFLGEKGPQKIVVTPMLVPVCVQNGFKNTPS